MVNTTISKYIANEAILIKCLGLEDDVDCRLAWAAALERVRKIKEGVYLALHLKAIELNGYSNKVDDTWSFYLPNQTAQDTFDAYETSLYAEEIESFIKPVVLPDSGLTAGEITNLTPLTVESGSSGGGSPDFLTVGMTDSQSGITSSWTKLNLNTIIVNMTSAGIGAYYNTSLNKFVVPSAYTKIKIDMVVKFIDSYTGDKLFRLVKNGSTVVATYESGRYYSGTCQVCGSFLVPCSTGDEFHIEVSEDSGYSTTVSYYGTLFSLQAWA